MDSVIDSGVKVTLSRNSTKSVTFNNVSRNVSYLSGDNRETFIDPLSYLELSAKFGRINRKRTFEEFVIGNGNALFPASDLFPANNLYPETASGGYINLLNSQIQNVNVEEVNSISSNNKWLGTILFDYLDTNNEVVVGKIVLSDYAPGIYYIEKNDILVKTQRTLEAATALVNQTFVPNIDKLFLWEKFEANTVGVPWVEAGDVVTVQTQNGQATSFVFSRSLKGIKSLMDNISADVDPGDYTDVEEGEN